MISLSFDAYCLVHLIAPVYYTCLWSYPGAWVKAVAPNDASAVMAHVCHAIKTLQFLVLGYASYAVIGNRPWPMPCWHHIVALCFGQYLNMRVYSLLGSDGVYYGVRFGKDIPWVTAFPYNSINDPQYVGCLFTTVGLQWAIPASHLVTLLCVYAYLIWLERLGPGTPISIVHAMLGKPTTRIIKEEKRTLGTGKSGNKHAVNEVD